MTALRLIIGADTFPPDGNGAAHFTHRLAVGLAGRGHEVHVLRPAADPRLPAPMESDIGATLATFEDLYHRCVPAPLVAV